MIRANPKRSWIARTLFLSLCLSSLVAFEAQAQRTPAYPQRVVDDQAVERGKEIYEAYACSFCHGADTRGGNGGPSLLRSLLVQRDQQGELIGPVIRNGRPNTAMTGFNLSDQELADVAEFLHSFELQSRDPSRFTPETIVVGDAAAGREYFADNCSECHSVRDDLQGLASRYPDPLDLQTNWLSPRNADPIQVMVTQNNGDVTTGALAEIDEFLVSLNMADGSRQTFRRRGNSPMVELEDPLQAHNDMLHVYTDADIHNVTAYLVTLEE